MRSSSHSLDRLDVVFDNDRAVADAGLVLPATLAARLGLEESADELISVGFRPRRKTATLVSALLAGADCIDDADILRAGSTGRVLGHDVMAPSTLGSWLFRTRVWLPAVKAAKLEGLRFHDLRHTFVALWVDAGVDPKEVSVRAGHSSVAFTLDRYGHLFEDDEDTISERLDAVLEESKKTRRRRSQ